MNSACEKQFCKSSASVFSGRHGKLWVSNGHVSLLVVLLLIISVVSPSADAGPFRERERFNTSASGFWMKGRCFFPGNIRVDSQHNWVFPGVSTAANLGCLVKNRKGKRRPGKRRADVKISVAAYIPRASSPVNLVDGQCKNVRRCRKFISIRRNSGAPGGLSGTVDPSAGDVIITGIIATICGIRAGDRLATRFEVHVGTTDGMGSGVRNKETVNHEC